MSKRTQFRFFRPGGGASKTDDAGAKQDRAGLLQRTKSADSLEMRAIHVHASEGDKCVAPARSKPKRRQTVREASDHDTLSTESIQWSDDVYTVEQVAERFLGQFPILAKVTQGGLNGTAVDCTRGQVYLVQSSGRQQRLLAQFINGNCTGANASLPLDCSIDVCLSGTTECMKLSKAVELSRLPVDVRVMTVDTADDSLSSANLAGRELRLNSLRETVFLRANAIMHGWVNQTKIIVIPDLVDLRLAVAVGMYDSSQQEWRDFVNMFDRAVRHLQFDTIAGYNGILTDESSSRDQSRQHPYENVITLTSLRTLPTQRSRDLAELAVVSSLNTDTIESGHQQQLGGQRFDTQPVLGRQTTIYVNGAIPSASGPSLKNELEATDEGYHTRHSTLNELPAELTEMTTVANCDDVTTETDHTIDMSPVSRWLNAAKPPETRAKNIKPNEVRRLSPATPQKTAMVRQVVISSNTNKQLQPVNVPQKTAKPTAPLPVAKKKKVPTATLR